MISSAVAVFACITSYAQATCDPAAAVRLVAVDQSPEGSRTPLVLIHGIHGVPNGKTVCDGDGNYWASFENDFSECLRVLPLKLYEVYYVSDTYPVPVPLGFNSEMLSIARFPAARFRIRHS